MRWFPRGASRGRGYGCPAKISTSALDVTITVSRTMGTSPQRGNDSPRQCEIHRVTLPCGEVFQHPAPGAGRMLQRDKGADICHTPDATTAACSKQTVICARPQQTAATHKCRVSREPGAGAPAQHPSTCARPNG